MNQINQTDSNAQNEQENPFEFEYLGPEYDEGRHGAYLEMLSSALEDPRCHNIALSGPYGCGKTSIIEEYRRQNPETTLVISLWSLSPEPQEPVSASEDSSADGNPADTLTNRLEREIVRQILYSGTHDAVPFSRFNRMHPINPSHRLLWAGAISLAVGLGFALYGEGCPLTKLVPSVGPYLGVIRILFCGVVAFFLVRALYPWAVAGLRSLSISSGQASASFSLGSGSYFDKYLDEIIYFFEANQYNTVIFEDLDRFDDPLIYTGLRDLNLVLNNAPGIRSKVFVPTKRAAQPSDAEREDQAMGVRFVYALRDGVFDGEPFSADSTCIGNSVACVPTDYATSPAETVPGTRRVKFFDMVIPVMPFLSALNAFDVALPLFKDVLVSSASYDVLRIVVRHLVDMRLIKELKNEFILMKRVMLIRGDTTGSRNDMGLTEAGILAMAAYKCVRPSDYEAIALGKSDLDRIYDVRKDLIERYFKAQKAEFEELAERALEEDFEGLIDDLKPDISEPSVVSVGGTITSPCPGSPA